MLKTEAINVYKISTIKNTETELDFSGNCKKNENIFGNIKTNILTLSMCIYIYLYKSVNMDNFYCMK
jgi:hypothetical protein